MIGTTTLCWNCSTVYPVTANQCPACGMANANTDNELAAKQAQSRWTNDATDTVIIEAPKC